MHSCCSESSGPPGNVTSTRPTASLSWASNRCSKKLRKARVVTTATTMLTAATSAIDVRTNRPVSVVGRSVGRPAAPAAGPGSRPLGLGSAGRLEDISRSAHRVDHRCSAGVDLLPQVGDVQLDDVGLSAEVVVPDPVQDL